MPPAKRLAFLTGAEFELRYETNTTDIDALHESGLCLPLTDRRPPPVTQSPLIKSAQDDARAMLARLNPHNDDEADRLRNWKQEVGDFTIADAINFRVYENVSVPSLNKKFTTVGMQYSEVAALHGGAQLEFRFGTGQYQSGYYDGQGISEARLTPRPSEQYGQRRLWLFGRAGRIATAHGAGAYLITEHINSSVFDGEQPILGDPEQDITPYRLVTAGLNRLFMDGALYDSTKNPPGPPRLKVGPWRTSNIRIVPGRFELRTRHTQGQDYRIAFVDQVRSHQFMLQAMEYGLRYADKQDVAQVPLHTLLVSRPAAGFDPDHDLGLLRYLGTLEQDAHNRLLIAERYSPLAAFGRMAGKQELIISDKQQELFVSNLTIQDGHVRIGAEGLARFVASQNPFAIKNWSGVTADSVNQKLSVISVKPSPMVSLDARLNHDLEGPVHDITRAKQSLGRVAPQAYTALADTYRKPR